MQKTGHRFRTKGEGQDALAGWRSACKADPSLLSLSYGDWLAGKAPRVESEVRGSEQPFRVWAARWLRGKDHRATTAEAAAKYLLGKPRWDSTKEPGPVSPKPRSATAGPGSVTCRCATSTGATCAT